MTTHTSTVEAARKGWLGFGGRGLTSTIVPQEVQHFLGEGAPTKGTLLSPIP